MSDPVSQAKPTLNDLLVDPLGIVTKGQRKATVADLVDALRELGHVVIERDEAGKWPSESLIKIAAWCNYTYPNNSTSPVSLLDALALSQREGG